MPTATTPVSIFPRKATSIPYISLAGGARGRSGHDAEYRRILRRPFDLELRLLRLRHRDRWARSAASASPLRSPAGSAIRCSPIATSAASPAAASSPATPISSRRHRRSSMPACATPVGAFVEASTSTTIEIDDLIERYQDGTDLFFFRNRGRARIRGIELEMQAEPPAGRSTWRSGFSGRAESLSTTMLLSTTSLP